MAFGRTRPTLSSPLVPVWNDLRALQVFTSQEYMQKRGPGFTNTLEYKLSCLNPVKWYDMMKVMPGGKAFVGTALGLALFGGWGVEFVKNISVMTKEKPPIDWNNEKLGHLTRS
uniref:ATP synthase subunit k n=1 Tax=Euglena gracilis TaxID=3039 RepID=UPI0012B67DC7|nr:Chain K, ATP synthase subunit k [Euglena gracilis]6TDU_k Chain k, ATP synthase subunit k [Euglena gracilis]6TDV_K Chain K, subunit k [Euglena gracilis]6TDV_k Chain k, subunit k [Euglena gracilis]|eukprot:EG_transcript_55785